MAPKISGSCIVSDGQTFCDLETYLVLREVDGLCVTSTLDVEDTSVGPDVLVITNQQPVGVGTECRLSGTTETKEQCDVAFFA